jgi:GMP synthase-like glutamine amidotransferase
MKKPLKILVLDNTREASSFGSKNIVEWALRESPEGSEIFVRRPPDQDLPSRALNFDAIILSGSITSCFEVTEIWVRPYDEFVTDHLKKGTPILGICYGHQSLARCLFQWHGQTPQFQKSRDAELGWATVRKIAETPLLEGLPASFVTSESHYEEITETPPGTIRFAESDRCVVQGFEVIGKPAFGVQFHPEHPVAEVEEALAKKLKKGERKDWILNAGKGPKLYNDQVGKTIFGNFFKIADAKRS